eukprot:TRINITY_DN2880_c0_g1_i1.p1 TRINITY_DN2880_c0_g1~~TRINITY_DN2880_c0_g1_i1.p1  ORF type:complete len:571 (-),score=132.11 TRINITY_DN2880_c0_g1_i1:66-1679(-)
MGAQAVPTQPQLQQLQQQQFEHLLMQQQQRQQQQQQQQQQPPKQACWYWERGLCSKGHACPFSHMGPGGSQGYSNPTSTQSGEREPCWFHMRGACSKGFSCPFSHGKQSVGAPSFAALLSQQNPNAVNESIAGSTNPADFVMSEDQMQIPKSLGRSIIGQGGEGVKLLQQVTGCKVFIDMTNVGPDGLHTVRLHGIPAQREQAKALIEVQRQVEEQAKTFKYEPDEPANDTIYTSAKVALSLAGMEEEEDVVEAARVRAKITKLARKSIEGVDGSGLYEPLDAVIRQVCRNFFAEVCPVYYDRKWLSNVHFQLVMESAIKELVPASVLQGAPTFGAIIYESHDFAFEEQRFLPTMWEIVRPLVDGPKKKKKVYNAMELGRSQALSSSDEGSGIARAQNFLRNWISACLKQLGEDAGGEPEALVDRAKLLEIFCSLLAVPDKYGLSSALPSAWSNEAGIPDGGWMTLLEPLVQDAYATFQRPERQAGAKGGWGSSYGAIKGGFMALAKAWKGGKGDSSFELPGWAPPAAAFFRHGGPY